MKGLKWVGACVLSLSVVGSVMATGIPVVDVLTVAQTTISAMENVAMTAKQIEQYQTQLQQLEWQIKNSTNPSSYLWDDASYTISRLLRAVDTLKQYQDQAGGLKAFLDKFGNVDTYKDCPNRANCRYQYSDVVSAGSVAQKQANDAMYQGIALQQDQLVTDANNLAKLQRSAEGAAGQLEAIQVANQFASHQSQQLMQLRSLLMQQNAAAVARMQTENAKESVRQAADDSLLGGQSVRIYDHKGY